VTLVVHQIMYIMTSHLIRPFEKLDLCEHPRRAGRMSVGLACRRPDVSAL